MVGAYVELVELADEVAQHGANWFGRKGVAVIVRRLLRRARAMIRVARPGWDTTMSDLRWLLDDFLPWLLATLQLVGDLRAALPPPHRSDVRRSVLYLLSRPTWPNAPNAGVYVPPVNTAGVAVA